ncbi:MAG: DUF971 domain-containing protein [Phycisphaerae bacterium]
MDQANPQPSTPAAALSADAFRPAAIHLDREKQLTVRWADGRESRYPLAFLRKRCPCATCRTRAAPASGGDSLISGTSLTVLPAGIDRATIATSVSLVGNYALQVTWADGHNTGIYDFRYLRTIDPESGMTSDRKAADG